MRLAAIDVGSNSVHMIVCRVRPDRSFEVVDREKEMIRLAAGSLGGRELPAPAIALALQTLSKFKRLAESHGVDEIVAAATSAIREARNGAEFIRTARRDVGLHIRVISGTEEARLIHLAAAYAVGVDRRSSVVIDVGGGSTEITLGTAARVELSRSFRLGAIRLTERFALQDPLAARDERRLVRHIRREARAYLRQLARRGFQRVIGTSGTIMSLGALASGNGVPPDGIRNLRVPAQAFGRLRRRLVPLSLAERLKLPGLDPRRADLAAVSAILLDTLLGDLGAEDLTLCDFALREGLVLDYVRRNATHIRTAERYPDVRRRSVIELAERCSYYAAHARQVTRLALALFDGTQAHHGLGSREREWLEYAALLHDIGHHISYERHHKHSRYLIRHGGLRGFEPDEIETIGLVARYHRRATPKASHRELDGMGRRRRRTIALLAACVRLAEGLDRSHAQVIRRLTVRDRDEATTVRLHTAGDADLELWAADRHAAPLARLLGRPLTVELAATIAAAGKDTVRHARHASHATHLSRPPVRRRGHRRVGQDDSAGSARQVADRQRPSRLRH